MLDLQAERQLLVNNLLRNTEALSTTKDEEQRKTLVGVGFYIEGQIAFIDKMLQDQKQEELKREEADRIEIELKDFDDEPIHISKHSLQCKIATEIFAESTIHTTNSSRYIYAEDIEKTYNLEEGFIDEQFMNEVEDLLYWLYGEQIAEVEVIFNEGNGDEECDRCWSITLYHNYCVGIIEDDQAIKEYRPY